MPKRRGTNGPADEEDAAGANFREFARLVGGVL